MTRGQFKYKWRRLKKALRRYEGPLMKRSSHRILLTESQVNQRRIWTQKLQETEQQVDTLVSEIKDRLVHARLDRPFGGNGVGLMRLVLTVDTHFLEQGLMWGNDEMIIEQISKKVAYDLKRELLSRNAFRLREGMSYELGRFEETVR